MSFQQKLEDAIKKKNSLLCIGLDPVLEKLPKHLLSFDDPLFEFNKAIIDATHNLVCCYKPNSAFYEAHGAKGLESLKKTIDYIHHQYTSILVILDAKRADIGNTSTMYAKFAFEYLQSDAITVNPYLGFDSLEPFLKQRDKGVIILCKTSNKDSSDFQDLQVDGEPLYLWVTKKAAEWNQIYKNCLLIVGATQPDELKKVREIVNDMFILVPGVGAQAGDLEQTLTNGLREDKSGLIINSSRTIIYASGGKDFANKARQEAEKLKNEINKLRL